MKRIFALILVLAMVMSLAACGAPAENGVSQDEQLPAENISGENSADETTGDTTGETTETEDTPADQTIQSNSNWHSTNGCLTIKRVL